jgi:TolB protein
VAGAEIFVINADGSGRRRLTNHRDDDSHPTWSPDGTKIAFDRNDDGYNTIWSSMPTAAASGSSPTHTRIERLPAWSPNR